MAVKLPAVPALELTLAPAKFSAPAVVTGQGGVVYRAPTGFQNTDLAHPCEPPASLGAFWPQPK